MPPADAAPDPLDRLAAAMAAALAAWCQEPPRWPGIWLPALPWDQWSFEQRDLARRLAAAVLAAGREQPDAGGATMTAEERAWAVADQFRDWLQLPGPSSALFNQVVSAMTAAVREAEAAAAARQRAADAAACRTVLEFWDRDSPAPGPYEAGAVAAAEMCVERIMKGGPDAGGGGAGGEG